MFPCVLQARDLLRQLPSLVDIDIPSDRHFTVCGDVHGQFYDLLHIWELNGNPGPDNPYLFNGECCCCCRMWQPLELAVPQQIPLLHLQRCRRML